MGDLIDLEEIKRRLKQPDAQNWSNPERLDEFILNLCDIPEGPYGFIHRVNQAVQQGGAPDAKDLIYLCAMSQELLFDWLFRKAAKHPELAHKLTELRDELAQGKKNDEE